ncbi:urease accessory protein UreF [Nonomuraea sp. NPDC050663]|uniref:urease accessory protein UreF n=1 Tax=Nonomuraea sp. NPDC050663 TaxID=3364370 RepID=UPI0037A364DD
MTPGLLLLTDSRLPAGSHAHSGGMEQAVKERLVHDLASLEAFLAGRLRTAGAIAAGFAAQACAGHDPVELDAELDARTAAPAQREAARTQGRLLLRVARRIWPSPSLEELAGLLPSPHHPIALGVTAAVVGATPSEAGAAAAYHAVTGPATAAVRLLGLDPVAVHRVLATLDFPSPDGLPAASAPLLDLLAERHRRSPVRLFVS